jgi:hypothetical protein
MQSLLWVSVHKRKQPKFISYRNFISEVIESWNAIQTKTLADGSVARVLDCCPQEVDTFQCIQKLGGICSEGDYPKPTGQCQPNKCKPFARVCAY